MIRPLNISACYCFRLRVNLRRGAKMRIIGFSVRTKIVGRFLERTVSRRSNRSDIPDTGRQGKCR